MNFSFIGMVGGRYLIESPPPGSILALVYTNTEQNRKKDKMNSTIHKKTFNVLYKQYTCMCHYKERIYKYVPEATNIHIIP